MAEQTVTEPPIAARPAAAPRWSRIARALSPRNASAPYVLAALLIVVAIWIPDTFLTGTTFKTLLNDSALSAIVAIALVVPLSAASSTWRSARPSASPRSSSPGCSPAVGSRCR
jgi:hypothetical protein